MIKPLNKQFFCVAFVAFALSVAALPVQSATIEDLVKRSGLYYETTSDTPFTGEVLGRDSGFFVNGLKSRRWTYRYPSGQIKNTGHYQDGRKQGAWLGYYANGQVFYEGSYLGGVKEGLWVSFYDDGELFYRGYYKDGKEDGRWVAFNPDGSVWAYRTGQFSDGLKIAD